MNLIDDAFPFGDSAYRTTVMACALVKLCQRKIRKTQEVTVNLREYERELISRIKASKSSRVLLVGPTGRGMTNPNEYVARYRE